MNESMAAERAAVRFVTGIATAVTGAALGWFAYVDAPISDRVMLWIAFGVAAGVVAALAGLRVYALTLGVAAATAAPSRGVLRLRRLSMLALAVQLLILAMAMVATLNLKGTDTAADTEDTSVAV